LCAVISLLGVVLICWPLSAYYWCVWLTDGPGPGSEGHPTYISGTGARLLINLADQMGFEDPAAFLDAFFGIILTLAIFALLRHFFGRPETIESHCRCCRRVLRGLAEPLCPYCGERI